ncbi:MAG TPA: ribokinase [bacterium]|nr:ribokinase [bacterium]
MVTVCVVGSLNMDLVVRAPRLPRVGETVTGGTFATFPGGKGANQAVAAARLGARVAMMGTVGDDAFGRQLIDGLTREAIDVAHVRVDAGAATGVAMIGVDGEGRNMIMVASGANVRVRAADVDAARDAVIGARVLLLQLEVPLEAVLRAAAMARAAGALVCLDPAPAVPLPDALYACVDVINPNEVEAQTLTGVEIRSIADAERAAVVLQARGPRVAVVKLGDRGAFYLAPDARGHVPAVVTRAVDTTAAGDAFAAALGVALGEGRGVPDAVAFATRAAGIKVTRMGAQAGMPTRAEVEEAVRR